MYHLDLMTTSLPTPHQHSYVTTPYFFCSRPSEKPQVGVKQARRRRDLGENSRQRRQFVHPSIRPSICRLAVPRLRAKMAGRVRRAARRQSSKTRPFSLRFLSLLPLLSRGQQFQNTEKVSAAIRASRSDVEFGCGNLIYCRWRGSLLHQGTQLTEDITRKRRFAVVVIRHACTRKLHISPIDAQSDT